MLTAAAFHSLSLNINLGNAAKIGQEKLTFGRNGAFIGVDKWRKKKEMTEGTEIEKFIDTKCFLSIRSYIIDLTLIEEL
jgi:hypothetical protein